MRFKKPTGSRYLIIWQLCEVIEDAIPRLETPEQADEMEANIHTMWKQGIINDAQYNKWKNGLLEVRKYYHW